MRGIEGLVKPLKKKKWSRVPSPQRKNWHPQWEVSFSHPVDPKPPCSAGEFRGRPQSKRLPSSRNVRHRNKKKPFHSAASSSGLFGPYTKNPAGWQELPFGPPWKTPTFGDAGRSWYIGFPCFPEISGFEHFRPGRFCGEWWVNHIGTLGGADRHPGKAGKWRFL